MNCPTCLSPLTARLYEGKIRLGQPGTRSAADHVIESCKSCGIAGLDIDPTDYTSDTYRTTVDGNHGVSEFPQIHDWEQASLLGAIGTKGLAGKGVAVAG